MLGRTVQRIIEVGKRNHSYCINPSIGLTADQIEVQNVARNFAKREMYPNMREWDEKQYFPIDVLKKAGEFGFGSIYCKSDFGGSDMTRTDASVIFEQLAMGCVSTATYITIHNMCCWMIDKFASDHVKDKFLRPLSNFDKLASYCLTEPDAGSDAASLRSSAKREGDYYIVNGSKAFISGAGDSDYYLVMMRHEGIPGPKGIFCLIVEKGMDGFSFGKKEEKMGWNTQPTRIITFEDVKVPITNQIGKDGQGFSIAMHGLNGGRLAISSCSLGAAQQSLDLAIEYTKVRKQFGKTLSEFQWNQFKLAEMATKLQSSRLFVRSAAEHLDTKSAHVASMCAMAKLHTTDNCYDIVSGSLQLFGGYGFLKDYPIQQYLRDLRVHQILEGTNEIMRMIISRDLLTKDTYWQG